MIHIWFKFHFYFVELLTCNEMKWSEWPTRGMRTWLPSFWAVNTSVTHRALNSCKCFKTLHPLIAIHVPAAMQTLELT